MSESKNHNTLKLVLTEITRVLEPIIEAAGQEPQPDGLLDIAEAMGLDLELILTDTEPLTELTESLLDLERILRPVFETGEIPNPADVPGLVSAIRRGLDSLSGLNSLTVREGFEQLAGSIGRRLVDYLFRRYLESHRFGLLDVLALTGAIREEQTERESVPVIDWGRLADFLSDPGMIMREVYGWGSAGFDAQTLFVRLQRVLWQLGVPAIITSQPAAVVDWLQSAGKETVQQLRLIMLTRKTAVAATEAGLSFLPLPPASGFDSGLALVPYGAGRVSEVIPLHSNWHARIEASADVTVDYGLIVRPTSAGESDDGAGPLLIDIGPLGNGAQPDNLHLLARLERESPAGERIVVLGTPEGGRLEVGTIGLHLGLDFVRGADGNQAQLLIAAPVQGARVVLAPEEGDGFLRSLLPSHGAPAEFSFTVGWSSLYGLHFEGSSNLGVSLPEHIEIGPVRISRITLQLTPGDAINGAAAPVHFKTAADIRATLGPVAVTVEQLGFETSVSFPEDGSGNLGLIDFRQSLTPPRGAAIRIDTGTVAGGGYLRIEPEKGRYCGVLQLSFHDRLVLSAIGLLATRKPDGTEGFSLLVIISAEFEPIQLGFGFTLNGVGGLIGVNRCFSREALQAGLRSRALDSILFPKDPLANVSRLISDLEQVFPQAEGRFVIGPMVIIGWGSPPVLTAELGVVLTLPAPVELALMGRMRMVLPTEDSALIRIKMDVVGFVDFAAGEIEVDAVLYDSRIVQYSLSGEMAMRLKWSGRPGFALAVGGLNPRFVPPPKFPDLERIAVNLATGDNPRIRLEAYVALTSNTFQIGARVDVYAEQKIGRRVFSVSGYLSFDALFEFSPFRFVTDIGASVTLKCDGRDVMAVMLELMLAGPAPWHTRGKATIRVLGISGSVSFDRSIGSKRPAEIPVSDSFEELRAALRDVRNWGSEFGDAEQALVTVRRSVEPNENGIMIHPLAAVTVRQRVLPLETRITRFGLTEFTGGAGPSVPVRIALPRKYTVSVQGYANVSSLEDYFAPAQFRDLTEQEKLSLPSFERFPAGVRIDAHGTAFSPVAESLELRYDEIVIDEVNDRFNLRFEGLGLHASLLRAGALFGSSARSELQHSGRARFKGPTIDIRLEDQLYTVATVASMQRVALSGIPLEGVTCSAAHAAANDYRTSKAAQADPVQVVLVQEVSGV